MEERLFDAFYEFDFFQAVRLLEILQNDRQGVGSDFLPRQECVRFRSHPSVTFPPSQLSDLKRGVESPSGKAAPRMQVAFMGLIGPSGALPRFYTEMVIDRLRQKDRTLYDFLDLFHHRLVSLFYRAWEKYHFSARFERAERIGRRDYLDSPSRQRSFLTEVRPRIDLFSQILLDFAGCGQASLRYSATDPQHVAPRTTVADDSIRFYCGLLGGQHRPASALERLLEEYLGLPVNTQQCIGQWLFLEPEDQTRLDVGTAAVLGENVVAGQRFRDLQSRFQIRIGPLTYAQYLSLLPTGDRFQQLADLSRLYAGMEFDIELQLILRQDEVPQMQLTADAQQGPRLGWNCWLVTGSVDRDRSDAVLDLTTRLERVA